MSGGERQVESLFEGVAPRREPPAEVRDRVLAAVEHEWRRHKRGRWRLPAALAATVVLAVAAAMVMTRPDPEVLLRVSSTQGLWVDGVLYDRSGVDLRIRSGSTLESDGSTRLTVNGRMDVRLRGGTRLRWQAPDALKLERGAVYLSTGGQQRVEVRTPLGVVRNLGTTFMVTLTDGALEVAMREGSAAVDSAHGSYTATARGRAGDVVTVDERRISARAEPVSSGRWQWIHDVHPGYAQRELKPLLDAIADDLGLALEFAGPAERAAALQGRLEGDLSGLSPEQALQVVLATSGFTRRADTGDALVIEFQSPEE